VRVTSEADREASYQRHVEMNAPYLAKIHADGDLAWFEDWENPRRITAIHRLGLPENASNNDLRRAVFLRRYR